MRRTDFYQGEATVNIKTTCKDVVKLSNDPIRGIALYNAFKLRPIRPKEKVSDLRVVIRFQHRYLDSTKRLKRISKLCRQLARKGYRIIEYYDLGFVTEEEYGDQLIAIPPRVNQ